jgi:hypothetical protein
MTVIPYKEESVSNPRRVAAELTPAAEVALANIKNLTQGAMSDSAVVNRALVIYWHIMEAEDRGEELRTRQAGGGGRTKQFALPGLTEMPKRYVR